MPATDYDDPLLDMSEEEIARRNVRMGISERDPDHQREEDQQAEIWEEIQNGDLAALTALINLSK